MDTESNKPIGPRVENLEKRVALIENYVLSQGENLKIITGNFKTLAAIPESLKNLIAPNTEAIALMKLLVEALDHLGQGLIVFESRQQAMVRFLSNFDAPVEQGAKEIFLDTLARQESVTEKMELFLKLIRQAREGTKQKEPPENPPTSQLGN